MWAKCRVLLGVLRVILVGHEDAVPSVLVDVADQLFIEAVFRLGKIERHPRIVRAHAISLGPAFGNVTRGHSVVRRNRMKMRVPRFVPILGAATLLTVGCGGVDKASEAYREGYRCGKVNRDVNAPLSARLSVSQMEKICSQFATAGNRSGDGLKNYRAGVRDGATR
jgi:hypothetical protein